MFNRTIITVAAAVALGCMPVATNALATPGGGHSGGQRRGRIRDRSPARARVRTVKAAASASRSSIARGSIRMTISSQVNANRRYSLRSAALPAARARSIHKSACSRNSCGVNTIHSKLRNNRSRSKHGDRLSAAATKPISARRSECRSRKTLMPSFHRR